MKLNLANPVSGLQKTVEVDDDKKLLPFFEKKMGAEVSVDSIGEEFRGYLFRVSGGNDKQGFPMMQGVLSAGRVRLLLGKNSKCYRPRRQGERRRKSVRGCIVGPDLAVLNLVLVKKGPEEIPGLTDGERPRRLGPKRASHIRKLFNLDKKEDVRSYVVRRKIEKSSSGKPKTKAPRVQRLVTSSRLQRRRRERALVRKKVIATREAAKNYQTMLEEYNKTHPYRHLKGAAALLKKKKAAAAATTTSSVDAKTAAVSSSKAKASSAKGAATTATAAAAAKKRPATTTSTKSAASQKQQPQQKQQQTAPVKKKGKTTAKK